MKLRTLLIAAFIVGMNSAHADPRDWSGELINSPTNEAPVLPRREDLPDDVVPVPGSPLNGQITVEPGNVIEMPFGALMQKIAPIHLFWYYGKGGEARLCARLPFPVGENQILFMGDCFSHEELAEMPSLKTPSKKAVPGVDEF